MSFLHPPPQPAASLGFETLGYAKNPFPVRGGVWPEVYVERQELSELQRTLNEFLWHDGPGAFWALEARPGLGKSNFLRHIGKELKDANDSGVLPRATHSYVGGQPISPSILVQEMLQAISEQRLARLLADRPSPPSSVQGTDLGRFLDSVRSRQLRSEESAAFLARWLGGNQTYKDERTHYGLWSRERMPPAVAFPYLKTLFDLLAERNILTQIVLLLDEFEDVQTLNRHPQAEYVNALKGLLNSFNWERLFFILAGQEGALSTIGGKFTSLAARWKRVELLPIRDTDEAVALARAYMSYGHNQFLLTHPAPENQRPLDKLDPPRVEIENTFAKLISKERSFVIQRDFLDKLHELLNDKVTRSSKRSD